MRTDHPFRILKITGPAGMGKSRLALHICDWCHREYWLAGFSAPTPHGRRTAPVIADALAVLDYAASKSVAGQPDTIRVAI